MIKPRIADKEVTLHILKTFGIRLQKKLGQNFLIDYDVVNRIVAAADIQTGEQILEIGPGIGTLTQGLAETGALVTSIELDRHLIDILGKTLAGYDNVRIVQGDFLKLNISREMPDGKYKIIANLPYYITTPIIMRILEERMPAELLVTMVQKEVAERMVAKPGKKEYGALSVAVQYYTEPEIVFIVPPAAFIPPPAVESAVIRCVLRAQPPVMVQEEKMFFRVVKAAFSQRRKTLQNCLKAAGLGAEMAAALLQTAGIDGARRGETLSLQEFADIANAWSDLNSKQ